MASVCDIHHSPGNVASHAPKVRLVRSRAAGRIKRSFRRAIVNHDGGVWAIVIPITPNRRPKQERLPRRI